MGVDSYQINKRCFTGTGIVVWLPQCQLTHWGRDTCHHFADDILICIFLIKMYEFRLRFHENLFLGFEKKLAIFQHWFRWWLGADQAPSQCLNQCCLIHWRIYASLGPSKLTRLGRVTYTCVGELCEGLVQIMACGLNGAEPLSKPMLSYCQLGENLNRILINIRNFELKNMHLKMYCAKCRPIFEATALSNPTKYN